MSLWIFVLGCSLAGADPVPLQNQMEAAAKQYSRFATNEIVRNQTGSDSRWPLEIVREQARLRRDLLEWAKQFGRSI